MANAAPLLVYLRAIDPATRFNDREDSPERGFDPPKRIEPQSGATPGKMTRETVRKARYGRF